MFGLPVRKFNDPPDVTAIFPAHNEPPTPTPPNTCRAPDAVDVALEVELIVITPDVPSAVNLTTALVERKKDRALPPYTPQPPPPLILVW